MRLNILQDHVSDRGNEIGWLLGLLGWLVGWLVSLFISLKLVGSCNPGNPACAPHSFLSLCSLFILKE